MEYTFKILRFDPEMDKKPYFQEFTCIPKKMDSILETLLEIRNKQDPSLSFRYSCRESICGACGMVINGKISLACKMMIKSLKSNKVVIEPLPNLEILKDLVVDLNPFYKTMEAIDPFLIPEETLSEKGHLIDDKNIEKIFQFITCLWCGCCYSSCPSVVRDNQYLGPASLAKLYRFVCDPRDKRDSDFWEKINSSSGLWGCDMVFQCNDTCPKDVRPADGIIGLRKKILAHKMKNIFRKKT